MPPAQMIVDDEAMVWAEQLADSRRTALEAINKIDGELPELEQPAVYGTAGIRDFPEKLKRVAYRLGLLVAMRSKTQGTCGIMVTASHNPPEENGIKLVDKDGGFFNADWEQLAEMLVNSPDLEWSMKNLNELQIRGFPRQVNLFGIQAIPPPMARAQTLEEIKGF